MFVVEAVYNLVEDWQEKDKVIIQHANVAPEHSQVTCFGGKTTRSHTWMIKEFHDCIAMRKRLMPLGDLTVKIKEYTTPCR